MMKLHNIYPYNKYLFYTGCVMSFTGTYLGTKKVGNNIVIGFIVLGLLFMLLSLRKPKQNEDMS